MNSDIFSAKRDGLSDIGTGAVSILGMCVLVALSVCATAQPVWHWEGDFTDQEQSKLTQWIARTVSGVESTVAPYPFDVHIHFHRLAGYDQPVPWANTDRWPRQSVHFHVDPEYPIDDFLADWTAPHELSHLLMPYLGREYSWFAEGFASFMQYQVMVEMGLLSEQQALVQYREKVGRAGDKFNYPALPFAQAASRLRQDRQYPTMYWGGALYFFAVDEKLRQSGSSFVAVLAKYVACCRMPRDSMDELLAELDRLSKSAIFSEQMQQFETRPGFPPLPIQLQQTDR